MAAKKSAVRKSPKVEGYRDIFDPDSRRRSPLILRDCTSIEWPAGWSQADADGWRKANKLEKPKR